jgi:hypothetical protein
VLDYMDRVKRCARVPVCAGFGIRSREQVARFAGHVDGVVVGSALVEVLERGEDRRRRFLRSLRGAAEVMKRVFRAASLIQVAHARNVLMTAGIQRTAQSVSGGRARRSADAGNLAAAVRRRRDEQYALRALARAAAAPAGASWTCEQCGEVLEPQFTSCWRCGAVPCKIPRPINPERAGSTCLAIKRCRTNTDKKTREF